MKGKIIVIEGGEGSGKTTQSKMLIDYYKKNNIPVTYMDFPQYYDTFYGEFVAKFLRGEFGKIEEISPYLASIPYALDRLSVKDIIINHLYKGTNIICNRYVSSNLAHQAVKLTDRKKQIEFIDWIQELEYKVHQLPKEDIVILLQVPWKIGITLSRKKGVRPYLKGLSEDIHEKDRNHRETTEKMYLHLARTNPHWVKIDCVENGRMLPPETIHQKIISVLKTKGLIN